MCSKQGKPRKEFRLVGNTDRAFYQPWKSKQDKSYIIIYLRAINGSIHRKWNIMVSHTDLQSVDGPQLSHLQTTFLPMSDYHRGEDVQLNVDSEPKINLHSRKAYLG